MFDREKVKETFIDLIKIYSPSGKEEKVASYIIKFLKNIGAKIQKDNYGNVIAKIEGEGKPIALVAHMDTVEPSKDIKPIFGKDLIKSDGTTILGADDKAGITEILIAIEYLKKNKIKHRSVELIFTKEEEIGLRGASNLDFSKIISKEALVIDSCNPLGTIIIGSPYIFVINIIVYGREAHSGADPEKGVNAISIASKAISKVKTGKINKNTSLNIGIIKGGKSFNIVPDKVEITAEVRSYIKDDAIKKIKSLKKAFCDCAQIHKMPYYFKHKLVCKGYLYSKNDNLIKAISKINKKVGIKTNYKITGSGSDVNALVANNIKAVDIAYGGKNVHTTKESIRLSEIIKMGEFLVEFLKGYE